VPGGTTFEQYFRLEGRAREEQLLRFLVGLAPAAVQRHYVVDATRLALDRERVPSTPMGIGIASGMAATCALKLLLGRGRVLAAPWALQLDAYENRARTTWRPFGNANPLQRIALFMARRALLAPRSLPQPASSPTTSRRE
jgi:hypothetical protein